MPIWLLTVVTMICFAANSVLARLALRGGEIDGASFTVIRIVSGAAFLALLVGRRRGLDSLRVNGAWGAAAAMVVYAITFALAYARLEAGTGALILFAAVQATMIGAGMLAGERLGAAEWLGLTIALGGLVYLVSPGLAAPSVSGAVLMGTAGAAWGVYSLAARGVRSPVAATAGNFLRAAPLAAGGWAVSAGLRGVEVGATGVGLAVLSGAVTSGLGYVIWYTALQGLTASRAAIVQLAVPALAAAAGVLFLGERATWRLGIASVAILGGVGLALRGRR